MACNICMWLVLLGNSNATCNYSSNHGLACRPYVFFHMCNVARVHTCTCTCLKCKSKEHSGIQKTILWPTIIDLVWGKTLCICVPDDLIIHIPCTLCLALLHVRTCS